MEAGRSAGEKPPATRQLRIGMAHLYNPAVKSGDTAASETPGRKATFGPLPQGDEDPLGISVPDSYV